MERRDALMARREAMGFTQESFAYALNVDPRTVGRWEQGTSSPHPERLEDLARLLKVSLDQLQVLMVPAGAVGADSSPRVVNGELVTGRPDLATSPNLPNPAEGTGSELDQLLAYFHDQWHALVRTDNLLGPRFALSSVREHIAVIEDLLPVTTGNERRELVALAAKYAESLAWLYEDTAQMGNAVTWISRALEWAVEAGDDLLVAWTQYRRSAHAAANGDAQAAISLARAAGREGERLPNPMRAAIAQQEAYGHALAGDEVLTHRTLDMAHRWAVLDKAGDARGGHGSFCSEIYLDLQRARCWARLGNLKQAMQAYETALPALAPVYRRDRGVAWGRLAHVYVDAGEPEAAAQAGAEALTIARSSGSVRTEREVVGVAGRLEAHSGLQPVRQLLVDLSTVSKV